jgi:hypothetical protein
LAQGFENFENSLIKDFPDEEQAILKFSHDIQAITGQEDLYNMRVPREGGGGFNEFLGRVGNTMESLPYADIARGAIPIVDYFVNRSHLNSLPTNMPEPTKIPISKLNTDVDVSNQLNAVDNTVNSITNSINNNTANSNAAIAKNVGVRLRGLFAKNKIYSEKNALEKQLENANVENTQRINTLNTTAGNIYDRDQFDYAGSRASAFNRNDTALLQSAQSALTNVMKGQYEDEQLRLLGQEFGLDLSNVPTNMLRGEFLKKLHTLING